MCIQPVIKIPTNQTFGEKHSIFPIVFPALYFVFSLKMTSFLISLWSYLPIILSYPENLIENVGQWQREAKAGQKMALERGLKVRMCEADLIS